MENIKKIQEFLKVQYSYNCGNGTGSGKGDYSGKGFGSGTDFIYDFNSSAHIGDVDGSGFGGGSGRGASSAYNYGYGYEFGGGISLFNDEKVYRIDGVMTIIKSVRGNVAKGFILNSDFTLDKCFIVKDGRFFAHGKTLKEAIQSLNEKKWTFLDTDEMIAEFCKKFERGKSYKGSEFFEWHHYLTGSCLQGREAFVKNHNLNLDDEFTVDEFIKLTEEDYGKEIINQLKEVWENKE